MSEKPVHPRPRRLVDWINPAGARKVHSLIDKVYQRKNLEMAWERVKANRGSGGVDGQTLEGFAEQLDKHLGQLQGELKAGVYQPRPVRQVQIPKMGKPGEFRGLGIPTIYDRVCQQALLNRMEPIFEPVFDEANFGYRRGRSTKDALRKVWKEIDSGSEWIVDADLKDFFGSVDHEKLLMLVAQRVADGRVLRLIEAMLKAGSYGQGRLFPTERGTPQGGVASPLLSNILLTPFDREMRRKGYQLTRYADDWVVTCKSASEARAAIEAARRILKRLGVELHPQKTRIVHIQYGFGSVISDPSESGPCIIICSGVRTPPRWRRCRKVSLREKKESHDRSCYSLVVGHYRPKPISFRPIQPTEESTHAAENCIQEQRAELFRPLLSSR
jgi:RNA-directed DNA polymerase